MFVMLTSTTSLFLNNKFIGDNKPSEHVREGG
jgi:hypothetical protein